MSTPRIWISCRHCREKTWIVLPVDIADRAGIEFVCEHCDLSDSLDLNVMRAFLGRTDMKQDET